MWLFSGTPLGSFVDRNFSIFCRLRRTTLRITPMMMSYIDIVSVLYHCMTTYAGLLVSPQSWSICRGITCFGPFVA
jgi:hypothetical protein